MMKKHVKIILGVIAVLAMTLAGVAYYLRPLSMEAIELQPQRARLTLTEHGYVESTQDYTLYAEAGGRIVAAYGEKDQLVTAGTLLVELDASAVETEHLNRQALIRSYQAQIDQAVLLDQNQKEEYATSILRLQEELNSIAGQRKNADARRAEAPSVEEQIRLLELSMEQQQLQIDYAQELLERQTALYQVGIIPFIEVENSRQELLVMEKALVSLEEQKEARLEDKDKARNEATKISLGAEADAEYYDALTQAVVTQIYGFQDKLAKDNTSGSIAYYNALIEGELASLAALDTGKFRLYAPFDSVIVNYPAKNQSLLAAGSPAAVLRPLNDENLATIAVYVSTRDIASLAIGHSVELIRKLRDGDSVFTGTIMAIAPQAETMLSALGIEERRVKVSIMPNAAQDFLYPGYDLDVCFTLVDQADKFLVPSSAVFKHEEQDCVFLIRDGQAVIAPVTLGMKTNSETVLETGVERGDLVIADPNADGLRQGSRLEAIIR